MKCERLDVWKQSARFASDVYKTFGGCKDYGFKDQITRSGLSIPSNIAEGMEKESLKDQIRFLDIAKGSAAEFATQTYIAMDISYIEISVGKDWTDKADHLIAMITKLQQSLRKKLNEK